MQPQNQTTTRKAHRISTASAVQGVGVEDGEEDEQDGGDEAEGGGGADVAAELVVDVADLVPPRVLVPFEPHPRHRASCAGRRRHDGRVNLQDQMYFRLLATPTTFSPCFFTAFFSPCSKE